jgi:hypothetical protein
MKLGYLNIIAIKNYPSAGIKYFMSFYQLLIFANDSVTTLKLAFGYEFADSPSEQATRTA